MTPYLRDRGGAPEVRTFWRSETRAGIMFVRRVVKVRGYFALENETHPRPLVPVATSRPPMGAIHIWAAFGWRRGSVPSTANREVPGSSPGRRAERVGSSIG